MPSPIKNPSKYLEVRLEDMQIVALAFVEQEARNILRKNPALTEFCMAMGSATFTKSYGEGPKYTLDYLSLDERTQFKRLHKFIQKWDSVLKLTGTPMRFTADGPKITEW